MYGLLAAPGWGICGLAAVCPARRPGAFLTVITGEAVALAGSGTLMLLAIAGAALLAAGSLADAAPRSGRTAGPLTFRRSTAWPVTAQRT